MPPNTVGQNVKLCEEEPYARYNQKTLARLCKLASSTVGSSHNLDDFFWTTLYRVTTMVADRLLLSFE